MTRIALFTSPLMLGFDELERLVERSAKSSDSYPPYNVERARNGHGETWRITLAVAGFSRDELEVTVEDNQLLVRGRQEEEPGRDYLHRGIAARQFARSFVLAEGMEVLGAELGNGLLAVSLQRQEPQRIVRRIEIQ